MAKPSTGGGRTRDVCSWRSSDHLNGGVFEACLNIFALDVGVAFKNFRRRRARCEHVEDVFDTDTHAANTRPPAALLRIECNPVQFAHDLQPRRANRGSQVAPAGCCHHYSPSVAAKRDYCPFDKLGGYRRVGVRRSGRAIFRRLSRASGNPAAKPIPISIVIASAPRQARDGRSPSRCFG